MSALSASPQSKSLASRLPFHYGWLIVAVAALMSGVTSSIRLSFGVFLDPWEAQFAWSRADMALAYSIQFATMAVMAVGVGWLADRFGAKRVLLVGGLGFSISIFLTGTSNQLWQLYLYYGIILGAAMACFVTPLHSTTSLWFRKRIGLAVGTVVAFQAVGPLIGAPLFRWMTETVGWERCFFFTSAASLVVLVAAAFFFRNRPEDIGVRPYAEEKLSAAELTAARAPTVDGNTLLKRAVRTQPFWIHIATHMLGCISHSIPLVFVVSMATFRGIDGVVAAGVLGFISGVSIFSKLGMSIVAEYFGGRRVLIAVLFIQSSACLLLLFAADLWMFYLFAFIFGLGYGGEMVVYPMLNRQYYGSAPFASIYGWQMAGASFGMALGGYLGGLLFQIYDNYTATIWIAVLAGYVGVVAAVIMKKPNPAKMSTPDPQSGEAVAPAAPAEPALLAATTPMVTPIVSSDLLNEGDGDWSRSRYAAERALARRIDEWLAEDPRPEVAEVLEIVAARSRDRAFRLSRAYGVGRNGHGTPPVDESPVFDLLGNAAAGDRLTRLSAVLAGLADPASLPAEVADTPLGRRLLEDTRVTARLLATEAPARCGMGGVRLLTPRPLAEIASAPNGFRCRVLNDGGAESPVVLWVSQAPGLTVEWSAGAARLLVPVLNQLVVSARDGGDPTLAMHQPVTCGEEAAVQVRPTGDLPAVYLVVAAEMPPCPYIGEQQDSAAIAGVASNGSKTDQSADVERAPEMAYTAGR